MSLWMIIPLLLVVPAASVLLYYFTAKRRRQPIYDKRESRWRKKKPSDIDFVRFSLFLIGDAGAPSLLGPDPVLELLRSRMLSAQQEKSGVFFLGDNIYPHGMPRPQDPLHDVAEKRLLRQLRALEGYKGKVWFISGNHDWNKGREDGYEYVRRQQFYVESYFGRQDVYLPRNGCPGPVELDVNESLAIVAINTQWWVQEGMKPMGKTAGCSVDSEHEFFLKLDAILESNARSNKKIVVIGHHPVYSQAYHGGNFSLKQHIFPLTSIHKRLYVPIPVAGSLYPIYRKYIGSKEDMSHPKYKNLRKRLLDIFKKYPGLIYASGHDHNLQYIQKNGQHYIISGAGCKVNHVQKGGGAVFAHAHKGFMKLDFYYGGEVWLEVWEPPENGDSESLIFRKQIIGF